MNKYLRMLSLSVVLLAQLPVAFAGLQDADNPATDKFKEDIKAAVLNGSITIPQLKELQAQAETLKAFKAAQKPGAPVDLMTPWTAVSKMKAIMATVKQPDRETLEQDLQVMMANKQTAPVSAAPPEPGVKLGKDVFAAVMHGAPTEAQVKSLQDSLSALQGIKTSGEGKLQQFMTLKKSKSEIEQTMDAGEFRPQDRQAVLNDLNSLGPQGGGGGAAGGLRRGRL
jgi:glutamate synthase domain-containing protein 2